MSGGQAIYIFPCAALRKGTMHEPCPSQHMRALATSWTFQGACMPADMWLRRMCAHVEADHRVHATANEELNDRATTTTSKLLRRSAMQRARSACGEGVVSFYGLGPGPDMLLSLALLTAEAEKHKVAAI